MAGVSGSGKSTIARRLLALGHRAVSADSVAGLCRWIDRDGNPAQRPDNPVNLGSLTPALGGQRTKIHGRLPAR